MNWAATSHSPRHGRSTLSAEATGLDESATELVPAISSLEQALTLISAIEASIAAPFEILILVAPFEGHGSNAENRLQSAHFCFLSGDRQNYLVARPSITSLDELAYGRPGPHAIIGPFSERSSNSMIPKLDYLANRKITIPKRTE